MRRKLRWAASLSAMAWAVPGVASVTSASSEASSIASKMTAAGAAIGTLALVVMGYLFMAGHGSRQSLALWAAGLIVILCASYFARLVTA